jgi:RHS repeat-associated protein
MTRGNATHTYQADGQGSIRMPTDQAGNVTDSWVYTAFGEVVARTGTTENSFTYIGEQWDPNAGFYYLRARWYNPEDGRFTSSDPFEGIPYLPYTLHRYLYAGSNPIEYCDPSGLNFTLTSTQFTALMVGVLATTAIVQYAGYIQRTRGTMIDVNLDVFDGVVSAFSMTLNESIALMSDQAKQAKKGIEAAHKIIMEHLGQAGSPTPPDPWWGKDKLDDVRKHINNIRKWAERLPGKAKQEALDFANEAAAKAREIATKLHIDIKI